MHDLKWTEAETKLARRVFQAALEAELAEFTAELEARAAAAGAPDEIWALEGLLRDKSREIDDKYDYRYSQLVLVFGRLVREGRVQEHELQGLSEDKLAWIRRIQLL